MKTTTLPRPIGRQREVLYLPPQGHVVVLGTAGSGKTTLAILRSLYLSDPTTDHGGRTLLVTFNRCLVTYMYHLAPEATDYLVDVRNYHRFALGYLGSRNKAPWNCVSGLDERLQNIDRAKSELRTEGVRRTVLDRSDQFIDDELEWIQQHGIVDQQSYVVGSRTGRNTTRVARADRPVIFDLYKRYLTLRRQEGKLYDWCDVASTVYSELQSDKGERYYRHVVIDEGQDFSPEMLRSLSLTVPADGSLTFFGDIAQQIYGHRMSWRNAGLSARRIWRFEDNYRNTRQISRLAIALAEMPHLPDDPDLVEPRSPAADGPPPAKRKFSSESNELAFVIDQGRRMARTGTVAILFRTHSQVPPDLQNSDATRLHRSLDSWPTGSGLFYGTYHSAKGLEFDAVFLPLLSDRLWPHSPVVDAIGEQDATTRDARLLYVGITRAKAALILTYTGECTRLLPTAQELYQQ